MELLKLNIGLIISIIIKIVIYLAGQFKIPNCTKDDGITTCENSFQLNLFICAIFIFASPVCLNFSLNEIILKNILHFFSVLSLVAFKGFTPLLILEILPYYNMVYVLMYFNRKKLRFAKLE